MPSTSSKPDAKSALNNFNCGLALSKLGDGQKTLQQAAKYFETAMLEFKEQSVDKQGKYNCLFNLGATYRRLGDLDKSASFLKMAFAENASSPALYNSLGMTDFERGDFDAAVSSFDKAIDLSRD